MLPDKFNRVIFILPCPAYPFQRGQAKIAFKQAYFLRRMGYKTLLINIWFNSINNISKNKRHFKEAFDEIYGIDLNVFDLFQSLSLSIIKRILFKLPIQINLLNTRKTNRKFKKLIRNLNSKNNKENSLIYFFSIRSFPFWEFVDNFNIFYLVNLVDSVSLNIKNKINNLSGLKRLFWQLEYLVIRNFEKNLPISEKLISYVCVSKFDLKHFEFSNLKYGYTKFILSSVGVDRVRINEINNEDSSIKKTLIFTGSLYYEPNVTAISWLIEEIMPIIWEKDAEIKLIIAGSNPSKKVINLCQIDERIQLKSNPKDMNEEIKNSAISLAPMISGSGQQFKIIEAMMLSKPVVSTSKAANPLGLENNKNIIISDTANQFAESILRLLSDKKL